MLVTSATVLNPGILANSGHSKYWKSSSLKEIKKERWDYQFHI